MGCGGSKTTNDSNAKTNENTNKDKDVKNDKDKDSNTNKDNNTNTNKDNKDNNDNNGNGKSSDNKDSNDDKNKISLNPGDKDGNVADNKGRSDPINDINVDNNNNNIINNNLEDKKEQVKDVLNVPKTKPLIIFAVFAPGTNKLDVLGAKFAMLGFKKVSTRKILDSEIENNGSHATEIKELMSKKENISSEIMVDLIMSHVNSELDKGNDRFIIGGFPRCEENSRVFKEKTGDKFDVKALIFISYTRKEYEKEVEEMEEKKGIDVPYDEMMRRYDYFLMNTKNVDNDFGTSKMVKVSAKLHDDEIADQCFEDDLFKDFK